MAEVAVHHMELEEVRRMAVVQAERHTVAGNIALEEVHHTAVAEVEDRPVAVGKGCVEEPRMVAVVAVDTLAVVDMDYVAAHHTVVVAAVAVGILVVVMADRDYGKGLHMEVAVEEDSHGLVVVVHTIEEGQTSCHNSAVVDNLAAGSLEGDIVLLLKREQHR